MKVSAVP
jgi:hypothetical protein